LSTKCKENFLSRQDDRLKIKNNSQENIYYDFSYDYPDTSIDHYYPRNDPNVYLVKSNSEKKYTSRAKWEAVFGSEIPSDTLLLFIFDSYVLETIPWDTVRKKYLILKRYDLSYDDLERMNWTITYP